MAKIRVVLIDEDDLEFVEPGELDLEPGHYHFEVKAFRVDASNGDIESTHSALVSFDADVEPGEADLEADELEEDDGDSDEALSGDEAHAAKIQQMQNDGA